MLFSPYLYKCYLKSGGFMKSKIVVIVASFLLVCILIPIIVRCLGDNGLDKCIMPWVIAVCIVMLFIIACKWEK